MKLFDLGTASVETRQTAFPQIVEDNLRQLYPGPSAL